MTALAVSGLGRQEQERQPGVEKTCCKIAGLDSTKRFSQMPGSNVSCCETYGYLRRKLR